MAGCSLDNENVVSEVVTVFCHFGTVKRHQISKFWSKNVPQTVGQEFYNVPHCIRVSAGFGHSTTLQLLQQAAIILSLLGYILCFKHRSQSFEWVN